MSIKSNRKTRGGFTLVEIMIAVALFGIVSLALATIFFFSTRSFASMATYAELDKINRTAMDKLTYEIRQANHVNAVTMDNSHRITGISLVNGDGESVTYNFNAAAKQLVRTAGGNSQVLLDDCSLIYFNLFQRNPVGGTYNIYPAATNDWQHTVKVVSLTWKASRPIIGGPAVSENIQTAQVVIRKQ
jgi:prepilin-type N-terminal cleavage/methylation domain-containing protein